MELPAHLQDYTPVDELIRLFYEKYPDGRLTGSPTPKIVEIDGARFIWYHAKAYRSPEDKFPGDGYAAEPIPGKTQFTRDSELMNAETSARGRAIRALGVGSGASREEVQARHDAPAEKPKPKPKAKKKAEPEAPVPDFTPPGGFAEPDKPADGNVVREILASIQALATAGVNPERYYFDQLKTLFGTSYVKQLTPEQAEQALGSLRIEVAKIEGDSDVPF